jgi:hypothetical protein
MSVANVERFDLPASTVPCVACGSTEQWADLTRRPSHAQMKEHERLTRKSLEADSSLGVEDGMVHIFVTAWHVLDNEGNEVPKKLETLGKVPQEVLSVVVEEIAAITATTRPNDAIGNSIAIMNALKSRTDDEGGAKLDQAIALFREALKVPAPNAPAQTES